MSGVLTGSTINLYGMTQGAQPQRPSPSPREIRQSCGPGPPGTSPTTLGGGTMQINQRMANAAPTSLTGGRRVDRAGRPFASMCPFRDADQRARDRIGQDQTGQERIGGSGEKPTLPPWPLVHGADVGAPSRVWVDRVQAAHPHRHVVLHTSPNIASTIDRHAIGQRLRRSSLPEAEHARTGANLAVNHRRHPHPGLQSQVPGRGRRLKCP